LVSVINRYGLRASFHLNSSRLGTDGFLDPSELSSLFSSHEIAAHTINHPNLCDLSRDMIIEEVSGDIESLSDLAGYRVRGFSYPFGAYNDIVLQTLTEIDIAYARSDRSTVRFDLPTDFMCWDPTCHHSCNLVDMAHSFKALDSYEPCLFYIWGHSYEFHNEDNWVIMDEFGRLVGNDPAIWYATGIEIYDYMKAFRRLDNSPDNKRVSNPTQSRIWILFNDKTVELMPGGSLRL